MLTSWIHVGPTVVAAFLASLVEFVEALTVVLAVGVVRGWRGALVGSGVATLVLLAIIALLGPLLTRIPMDTIQLAVGVLLLLFGMRWLRKAILRGAGIMPMHDEAGIFAKQEAAFRQMERGRGGLDTVAVIAAFKITMLEGIEVVFIVIALGAGGKGLLIPASLGALAALLVVIAVGAAVHRPLSRVPENTLKFVVGVLLSTFGTFWVGEGLGLTWPGGDWSIPGLLVGFLAMALIAVRIALALRATRSRGRSRDGA